MDQNTDNKIDIKDKLILFFKDNKLKIITFIIIIFLFIISLLTLQVYNERKNNIISEKYILAGIFLANNNKIDSKEILEEIVKSKNKFYSILALNTILEKDLEKDKNKVLNYFEIVEKITDNKEKSDLLLFKKALYMMKNNEIQKGKQILQQLIDNNSSIKIIATQILSN